MSVEWSPNDTKSQLIEAARELGLDVTPSMLKADIIAMLESATASKPFDDSDGVDDLDLGVDGVEPPPIKPVKPPPVEVPTFGVLDYLAAAGERVSFEQIIKDCGPEAKEEVKALLAAGKVVQYKRHHSFWFEAK